MRISRTISEDGRTIWVCSCLNANIVWLPKGWEGQHFQSVLVAAECGLPSLWGPGWAVCATCAFSAQGHWAETSLPPGYEIVRVWDLHTCSLVLRLHWQIWLQMWAESSFPLNESWWKFDVSRVCRWDSVVLLLILHLPVISTAQHSRFQLIVLAYKLVMIKTKKKENLETISHSCFNWLHSSVCLGMVVKSAVTVRWQNSSPPAGSNTVA